MTVWQQTAILASQMSGWCSCHIHAELELVALGITGNTLADFVNRLQEIYGIFIEPEIFTSWVKLVDVSNYLSTKV